MKEALLRLDLRDERSGRPKYERLKERLVDAMATGRLKPGQALPSENRLVEILGVAKMTIRQAMASLESDGLIRRVQGKGNFVEADAKRKLKRGQDIFALVVPETRSGFYPALLHGFEAAAGDIHYQTLTCNTNNDTGRQGDIMLQLIDKQVGGVALNPTNQHLMPVHQVRQLQQHGIPVVFLHRRVEEATSPLLSIPFYEVGHKAGNVLTEHGHRRVALFDSFWTPETMLQEGLNDALRAGGADVPAETIFVSKSLSVREEDVLAALQNTFAKPDRPTAVFATSDSLAEMIYLLSLRLGVRVPEDVSLLGFGGSWREGAVTQRLTSIVVDEIATGRRAVELLHEMRCGDRPIDDNEEIVMDLGLSEGKTLGAPTSEKQRASLFSSCGSSPET